MPAARIGPARIAAFHILSRVSTSAAHSDDLLHSIAMNALSAEDRNLATALVLGVLRWQLALDAAVRPLLQRPDAELHPAAVLALRLGMFQLRHMDRVPAHAVLNDSVELARANGAAHAAGMVNAVLRRVQRESATPAGERKTLAITTEAELAHPAWLLARWRKIYGGKATRAITEYDQHEPPAPGWFLSGEEPNALLDPLQMDDGSRLVAEIAAAAASGPRRILDTCAAPGGKSIVLAARHPEAEIIAADISERRLSAMRKRLDREGLHRIQTLVADLSKPLEAAQFADGFDLILCDMPCSGTGTLARNPEVRHRLRESDLPRQAQRQAEILSTALGVLRPGGRVVFSTCSLEPEENEAVIAKVLTAMPVCATPVEAVLEEVPGLSEAQRAALRATAVRGDYLRTLPGVHPMDGFFAAVLQRSS